MKKNFADVLESYTIAEEGIFAKFKERREQKKLARAEAERKKAEAEEIFHKTVDEDINIVKKFVTTAVNKAKVGCKNLPWKLTFNVDRNNDEVEIDVDFFEPWTEDKYDELEDKYKEVHNGLVEQFENNDSFGFKNNVKIEIFEFGVTTFMITPKY